MKQLFLVCLFIVSTFLVIGQIKIKLPLTQSVFHQNSNIPFSWNGSATQLDISNTYDFSSQQSYAINGSSYLFSPNPTSIGVYYYRLRSLTDTSKIDSFTIINLSNLSNSLVYHINSQQGVLESNNKVYEWTNLNNTAFNATQTSSFYQPEKIPSLINGQDIVKFGNDGNTSTHLELNNFSILDTNFTIFTCYKPIDFTFLGYLLGNASPIGSMFVGGTYNNLNFGIIHREGSINKLLRMQNAPNLNWSIKAANYNRIFENSSQATIESPNGFPSGFEFNTIGVRPDNLPLYFYGYLSDVIIYNEIFGDSTRNLVENYLKTKYTPFPDLGKDTVVCGPSIKIGIKPDHPYSSILWSNGSTNVDSIDVTSNGVYWVQVQSFDWVIRDTLVVSGIVDSPQISINNDLILCYGDSLQVDYSPAPGFSPLWLNGQNSNSIIVKDSSQFIQVTHKDTNNCSASSEVYFIRVDSLVLQSSLGDDRNICDGANIYVETTSNQGPFSYSWSTGDTTNYTNAPIYGIQDIYVELSDFNSCVFKDTIVINALNLAAPIVNFISDTACPNTPTSFIDLSAASGNDFIIDWKWAFINNDSAHTQNASYSFPEGFFNVSLSVETNLGCTNTIVKQILTHKQPKALIKTPILCANGLGPIESISTVSIPDIITNYYWNIDNIFYTLKNPEVIIQNEGINLVELVVSTDKGCVDTIQKDIEVFPELASNFEATNICIGDTTQFTNTTQSFSVVDVLWHLGIPNEFSAIENPSFAYQDTGSYTIKLTTQNAIGCKNTIEKTITINPLPTAIAAYDNSCINNQTTLYDTSLLNGSTISKQYWKINTDSSLTDSFLYTFKDTGLYQVYYHVENHNGCTDDTIFPLYIYPLPFPNFTYSPRYGATPINIQTQNTTEGAIDYYWNFGDNTNIINETNPSYTYNENGTYEISLIAKNEYGCTDSTKKSIYLIPTELDLELENVIFTEKILPSGQKSYATKVFFQNVGTQPIENINFTIFSNQETMQTEYWEGFLASSEHAEYEFISEVIPNKHSLKYLCVRAEFVNDNSEQNLSNNTMCTSKDGLVEFSLLHPNPTDKIAFLDIIAKEKTTIKTEIIDYAGKIIMPMQEHIIEKGYNQLTFDVSTLQTGMYTLYCLQRKNKTRFKLFVY